MRNSSSFRCSLTPQDGFDFCLLSNAWPIARLAMCTGPQCPVVHLRGATRCDWVRWCCRGLDTERFHCGGQGQRAGARAAAKEEARQVLGVNHPATASGNPESNRSALMCSAVCVQQGHRLVASMQTADQLSPTRAKEVVAAVAYNLRIVSSSVSALPRTYSVSKCRAS